MVIKDFRLKGAIVSGTFQKELENDRSEME